MPPRTLLFAFIALTSLFACIYYFISTKNNYIDYIPTKTQDFAPTPTSSFDQAMPLPLPVPFTVVTHSTPSVHPNLSALAAAYHSFPTNNHKIIHSLAFIFSVYAPILFLIRICIYYKSLHRQISRLEELQSPFRKTIQRQRDEYYQKLLDFCDLLRQLYNGEIDDIDDKIIIEAEVILDLYNMLCDDLAF